MAYQLGKGQLSYDHGSQAMLSSVSTWLGDCSSVVEVLLSTEGPIRWPSNKSPTGPGVEDVKAVVVNTKSRENSY